MFQQIKHGLQMAACLVIFGKLSLFSQNIVTKTVVDSKTKLPLEYVYLNSEDHKLNLMTNKAGKVFIDLDLTIKSYGFYKIGYSKQTIPVEMLIKTDTIFLNEAPVNLQEITITSRTLDTIIRDKRFYVDDYVILPNNDFMIITSKINVKGFEVAYYKPDKGITCRKKITSESNAHFFSDCFKNIHVLTNAYSIQLFFTSDSTFDFMAKYTKEKFDSTVALCALKIDTELVLKTSPPPVTKQQAYFDYKVNPPVLTYVVGYKNTRKNLYTVFYNKQLREMAGWEVKDVKYFQNLKISLSDQNPTNRSFMGSEQSVEADLSFFFTKVAKPIYAPIFLRNDTVVLFNFQEKMIVFLNKTGDILKQVAIDDTQFSTFREFEIIYDAARQNFYYRYKEPDKTTLSLINIYTGKLVKKIHLEKPYAKNIQVLNNKIYYLVREKDWDDTSYLYQQNI